MWATEIITLYLWHRASLGLVAECWAAHYVAILIMGPSYTSNISGICFLNKKAGS